MTQMDQTGENEFSRILSVTKIGPNGVTRELSADAPELAALATRFNLIAVGSLTAVITVTNDPAGHRVHLQGSFTAEVVQSCVVTLDPVDSHVEGVLDVVYLTDGEPTGPDRDMAADADIAPDEDDMPECLEGDEIDMGEIVAEHLGLGLDPYPRCPGVEYSAEDDEDPAKTSPFAVLRDLKSN